MGKRKLNQHDVPEEVSLSGRHASATFDSFDLDPRILQGIIKEQYTVPTLVQTRCIPLALEGKDILARSKTGSGKTAAYVLPILQSVLKRKSDQSFTKCTSALILVPTRELAGQVTKVVESLAAYCAPDVRIENLTRKEDEKVQRVRLADYPDIVVATPGRASVNLNSAALSLEYLAHLVIDEADLVLSYGYEGDLENIAKSVPKGVQTFLMSATLRTELDTLKGLFCRNPVLLELDEEERDTVAISQYVIKCAEDEKFLLIYAIFMLRLIKGKCIVFVGDVDRCYRLKLFLEQFGIKSCVLNSELPVNSRIHVVEEFNKNVYDIIIASDEHEVLGDEGKSRKKNANGDSYPQADRHSSVAQEATAGEVPEEQDGRDNTADTSLRIGKQSYAQRPKKKQKVGKGDREYGISRGIDFKNVACVLNFDLPLSSKSYTHRIGRTARAGKAGMALSFVVPAAVYAKAKATSIRYAPAQNDEFVLAKIIESQAKKGHSVQPYNFDMARLDGFRYRLGDALRAVTGQAVADARKRELRQEFLKSEKLRRHFEENPTDLQHLRHDGELRAVRMQAHLKHVPDYLLPTGGQKGAEKEIGFVGFAKVEENRIRKARMQNRTRGKGRKTSGRGNKVDPLKTFNARGRR